jgi:beta-galactosidase
MAFTRTEYPRPQFQRKFWQNLNGSWGFCFDDEERGVAEKFYEREEPFDMRINVPFTYQSKASGLGLDEQHEVMWYRRTFALEDALKGAGYC